MSMKAILEFNLGEPEDRNEHKMAVEAAKTRCALDDVWDKVFRPNNKHGYPRGAEHILNKEESYEVIEALEAIYTEVLGSHGVDIVGY